MQFQSTQWRSNHPKLGKPCNAFEVKLPWNEPGLLLTENWTTKSLPVEVVERNEKKRESTGSFVPPYNTLRGFPYPRTSSTAVRLGNEHSTESTKKDRFTVVNRKRALRAFYTFSCLCHCRSTSVKFLHLTPIHFPACLLLLLPVWPRRRFRTMTTEILMMMAMVMVVVCNTIDIDFNSLKHFANNLL